MKKIICFLFVFMFISLTAYTDRMLIQPGIYLKDMKMTDSSGRNLMGDTPSDMNIDINSNPQMKMFCDTYYQS